MKYIRTKDGKIFDVNKICVPYQIIERWIDFNSQGRFEIIKQADNIEELCDNFVVIDKKWNQKYVCCYIGDENCFLAVEHDGDSSSFSKKELLEEGSYDVYAAIWTDKGLIYKAKMNEKGELELL